MDQHQDDQKQSNKPISNLKKYGLLSIAAILLISAYFVGQSVDINQTYNNQAFAEKTESSNINKEIPKNTEITAGFKKRFLSDEIIGDKSQHPKVTLIEYGSLTCPHCAHFHKEALLEIKNDYIDSNKIQYIYRDYPLDGAALKASLLAKCDSSKRSAFIDVLYKKQNEWTRGKTLAEIEKTLFTIGKMGGLPSDKIQKCFENKALIEEILTVQKESNELFEISATPTILINNQKFTGGLKKSDLKQVIDNLLK